MHDITIFGLDFVAESWSKDWSVCEVSTASIILITASCVQPTASAVLMQKETQGAVL